MDGSVPEGWRHGIDRRERPPETYAHGHHASVLRIHRQRDVANSAASSGRPADPGPISPRRRLRSRHDHRRHRRSRRARPGDQYRPGRVVLDEARHHAVETGVDVAFEIGDVYALEAADNTFDIVHAHQVLQHLSDPVAALREMRRVCRPGGIVAVREVDYGSAVSVPDVVTDWLAVYDAMARRGGGRAERRTQAAWLGAPCRARRRRLRCGLLVLLDTRRTCLVGGCLGRAGGVVELRGGLGRAGRLNARAQRGDRPTMAGLGGRARRVVRDHPWLDPRSGLVRDSPVRGTEVPPPSRRRNGA